MLLELKQVEKSYGTPGGQNVPVLRGISLTLAAGESMAVIGPSGSGKSTLLNLLGALDRPTAGSITFDGRDLSRLSDDELSWFRNREIGFVFQLHHLLPQCTVWENVLLPTLASRRSGSMDRISVRETQASQFERARALLKRVGLGDRLDHRPGQLSGGERQRVAVVRALINEPRLLLADEPTGALDETTAGRLIDLLTELNREKQVALILVTHALDLARKTNRVYRLDKGFLKAEP
ncbi:MAG TPA: ABC transporter ATP-binding protein [Candidatus Paceibacterota bacterium]|nr:ABC transporter ATP-binding protein [Verrucomicrobiota bacterium]HRY47108.1 ABC transporter ATP-binding protein [Candidatus Paceibacterota bacterium]HSA02194.1 ABC transporter ATP-binding protein [Candidatus Paceibacterota bacterium]